MGEFYLWLSIFLLKVISLKNKIIVMMGVCLAATGLNAQAADVRVKGTIAPASCSFTIVNSVFDYGMIRPSSLSATHYTKLDKKKHALYRQMRCTYFGKHQDTGQSCKQ